jgi:hypothetical protein
MLNSASQSETQTAFRPSSSPDRNEPPSAVTLETLHQAAPDLLDLARRIIAVDNCRPGAKYLQEHFDVLVAFAHLAIEKAEGRR